MNKFILFFFLLLTFSVSFDTLSVEPDEILENSLLEKRARDISKKLRCLVCQNEDIDNSNADIAKDLRLVVREQLVNGQTNEEIINFVHKKYGDYVLYKPPIRLDTIFLWLFPFIFFIWSFYIFFRKQKNK